MVICICDKKISRRILENGMGIVQIYINTHKIRGIISKRSFKGLGRAFRCHLEGDGIVKTGRIIEGGGVSVADNTRIGGTVIGIIFPGVTGTPEKIVCQLPQRMLGNRIQIITGLEGAGMVGCDLNLSGGIIIYGKYAHCHQQHDKNDADEQKAFLIAKHHTGTGL